MGVQFSGRPERIRIPGMRHRDPAGSGIPRRTSPGSLFIEAGVTGRLFMTALRPVHQGKPGSMIQIRVILIAAYLLGLACAVVFAQEEAIKGRWHTEPDPALAEALKAKQPVLAVAMDHG